MKIIIKVSLIIIIATIFVALRPRLLIYFHVFNDYRILMAVCEKYHDRRVFMINI